MKLTAGKQPPKALVVSINREHALAVRGQEVYETHAVRCGEALNKARMMYGIKHGAWIPWIKKHCEFSYDSAIRYMRLAEETAANLDRVPHLKPRTQRQVEADRRAARAARREPLPSPPQEPEYNPMEHLGTQDTTHQESAVKQYLDALRVFQQSVMYVAIPAAQAGLVAPEAKQFVRSKHVAVRQLLTQLEGLLE